MDFTIFFLPGLDEVGEGFTDNVFEKIVLDEGNVFELTDYFRIHDECGPDFTCLGA